MLRKQPSNLSSKQYNKKFASSQIAAPLSRRPKRELTPICFISKLDFYGFFSATTLYVDHKLTLTARPNQGSLTEGEGSVRSPCTNKFSSAAFTIEHIIYLCYKTTYLNEEVNCTEPPPSFSVPWTDIIKLFCAICN